MVWTTTQEKSFARPVRAKVAGEAQDQHAGSATATVATATVVAVAATAQDKYSPNGTVVGIVRVKGS